MIYPKNHVLDILSLKIAESFNFYSILRIRHAVLTIKFKFYNLFGLIFEFKINRIYLP